MPLSTISPEAELPLSTGDTPEAGLIVSVFVALEPAFGLTVIGKVSAGYVLSVSWKVTGPVMTRVFRAATAAVSVVKSPPAPTLKLPLIVEAPVRRPTAK